MTCCSVTLYLVHDQDKRLYWRILWPWRYFLLPWLSTILKPSFSKQSLTFYLNSLTNCLRLLVNTCQPSAILIPQYSCYDFIKAITGISARIKSLLSTNFSLGPFIPDMEIYNITTNYFGLLDDHLNKILSLDIFDLFCNSWLFSEPFIPTPESSVHVLRSPRKSIFSRWWSSETSLYRYHSSCSRQSISWKGRYQYLRSTASSRTAMSCSRM